MDDRQILTEAPILIVRYGEVALKGMNKPWFERTLLNRIKKALSDLPDTEKLRVERSDGLMVVSGYAAEEDGPPLIRRIARVFGVASVSPAWRLADRDLEKIKEASVRYVAGLLDAKENKHENETDVPLTFKVFGKRSDKTYPVTSPRMSSEVGAAILKALAPQVRVDVKNPQIRLNVHLRRREVFLYDEMIRTLGGLPLGMGGRGMVLLSGGIDSPAAAWLMAKRGMNIEAIHFHSWPFTSERAREKVEELTEILAGYCGRIRLHTINLLPAQEAIVQSCPEGLTTILVRRFMMRLAQRLAVQEHCHLLITGENLGQVASQTAEALVVTDAAVTMPVMRPLIALDKTDIMDLAREIGTYEKSIEPYEDCCTVFLPRHPVTRPTLDAVLEAESLIPDLEGLEDRLFLTRENTLVK